MPVLAMDAGAEYGDGIVPNRDSSGIGILDGGLNVVDKDAPAFKPKVFDADGNEVDPDDIQPDAPADE